MNKNTLSIIIPVYNESRTLKELVKKVITFPMPKGFTKEIIVIDDCSKDNSRDIMDEFASKYSFVKFLKNKQNMGKSQTVKRGILASTGSYVVIQDADLEYNPMEIAGMLEIAISKNLDVVYGNRFGRKNAVIYWQNYWGNKILTAFSNVFTYPRIRIIIPDMEVCYKLVKGEIVRKIGEKIISKTNFGFEPEITAKLSRYKKNGKHLKFSIVPISYTPRTISEGKHMKAVRDGMKALVEIVRFNIL